MTSPCLFVVADVGGPAQYHLGDEAMLQANLNAFRQLVPDVTFTVTSQDPPWTSRRYGVESVPFLGPDGRCNFDLRGYSGLVLSGGGNLCATWPDKVLQRAALLRNARDLQLPTVVLGQTLGPALTGEQRVLLAEPLRHTGWLGVRDENSEALALALGVAPDRVHRQLDDAFYLEPVAPEGERAKRFSGAERFIAVTLDASFASPARERLLTVLASQVGALAETMGARVVFVPHACGSAATLGSCDVAAGRAFKARFDGELELLELWQPSEVRGLVERAALVISTRYHPLVFATAAAVPALGIFTDEYTRTKLRGALLPAGLEGWCMPGDEAERGALLPLAFELWSRRREVVRRLVEFRAEAGPREVQRWEEICGVLKLQPQARRAIPAVAPRMVTPSCTCRAQGPPITDQQWAQYERQGFLRLGKLLDEEQLAAIQQRLDAIMLGRVRYPTLEMQLDTGGAYEDLPEAVPGLPKATLAYRKVQGLEADPLVLELLRREVFRAICAWHYGSHASISVFRVMMMNKPAGQGTYLPWHQDAGDVWRLDRDPLVTSWIALDPATRSNGCVQVIPGSHRLGLLSKHGSTLSAADVERHCPSGRIEFLELEAGEGLLLHNWLLHRSDVNRTGAPRRALSVCYMDGRTLNALTGRRFPIVFGEHEEADSALAFVSALKEDNRRLREMAEEAQRYAKSLLEDNRRREEMRREAERYAHSLLDDNRRREQMRLEAERYAASLELELERVRGAAAGP